MAKKTYIRPFLNELEPGEDPIIVHGGSQGTSGYDSQWKFSGIDEDTLALIEANCDDYDLQDMDTNDDYVITLAEYEAWYEQNGWW